MLKKEVITIARNGVKILLSVPRGKVRIADNDGNHVSKPTLAKNTTSNWIEWMISNDELNKLIDSFLSPDDKVALASRIKLVNNFLNESEYAKRIAKKTTPLGKFEDFNIFEYGENFFSFEKELDLNIKIRITFKMGDYTLAPHMFILFPFDPRVITLSNCSGLIANGGELGSGCYAVWKPNKSVICEAMEALAHASEGHKRDLLAIIK